MIDSSKMTKTIPLSTLSASISPESRLLLVMAPLVLFGASVGCFSVQRGDLRFIEFNTAQMVSYMGYKVQSHSVQSGGYVIQVTRMINPLAEQRNVNRTVLFLHGILQDSVSEWLPFGQWARPEKPNSDSYSPDIFKDVNVDTSWYSRHKLLNLFKNNKLAAIETLKRLCLPCMFANNNYDVWLMDERGTTEGSSQVTEERLKSRRQFWNFTIDDTALLDLPNVIDYVINISGRDKISYVGFSKGTINMFALLSARPEYSEKLTASVMMTPVFTRLGAKGQLNIFEILEPLLRFPLFDSLIRFIMDTIVGRDSEKENLITDVALAHFLAPLNLKTAAHLGQSEPDSPALHMFNYGNKKNLIAYGQENPPIYDLSRVKLNKIIMARSQGNDYLSTRMDQETTINLLGVSLFKDIIVPDTNNHFGLIYHKDNFQNLFAPIVRAVNEAYLSD